MKNKTGTIVLAAAVVFMLIAFVVPFQSVGSDYKFLVEIKKPIQVPAGIIALVVGVLAVLLSVAGKKKPVLILSVISAAMVLLMVVVNKSHKVLGIKIPVKNEIGFTLSWVAMVVMLVAGLFYFVTTKDDQAQ